MVKRFILALQPHENQPTRANRSPWSRNTLAFCAALVLLMGLAFPMTTPDVWQENVRVGLLKYAYGWQTSPLIGSDEAGAWYSDLTGKTLKSGCKDARERDWEVVCPVIQSQGMLIDCANANPIGKAEILNNIQRSKTTKQYACLYGN